MKLKTMIVKSVTTKSGATTVIASTPTPDRYQDIVAADWNLESYKDVNPVVLWAHNYDIPPVGRVLDLKLKDNQLIASIEWDTHESNELGRTVASQFKRGFLNAVSVGFTPGESIERSKLPDDHPAYGSAGYFYSKNELMEISAVPIPAHRDAIAIRQGVTMAKVEKQEPVEVPAPEGFHWMDYEGGPVLMAGEDTDHEGASPSFEFEVIDEHDPERLKYGDDEDHRDMDDEDRDMDDEDRDMDDEDREHEPGHDEYDDEEEEDEEEEDDDSPMRGKSFELAVRAAMLNLIGSDPSILEPDTASLDSLSHLFGIDK